MKNLFKLIGIIAVFAIIGFSFTACGDGGGGGGEGGGGGGEGEYEEPIVRSLEFYENVWRDDDDNIVGGWHEAGHEDWSRWNHDHHHDNGFDVSRMLADKKVYIFHYKFSTDQDIKSLGVQIFDTRGDWTVISDYTTIKENIKANTKYSGKVVIFPNSKASGTVPDTNMMQFGIHRDVVTKPTLHFYKFEFEQVDKEEGLDKWIVSGKEFAIDTKKTFAEKVEFEGKTDVLHVRPAYNIEYDWNVMGHDLSAFNGKTVEVEMSMDVYLKKDAWIAWQLNDRDPAAPVPPYPVISGTVKENDNDNPWSPALPKNTWHHVTGKNFVKINSSNGATLYLSEQQIKQSEAYIANATIKITDRGNDKLVILKDVTQDGTSTSNPTKNLTLTLNEAIPGLSANDITLSNGSKGTLNSDAPIYTLPVTISVGGNLNVTVAKTGYAIFNGTKTINVFSDGSNTFYSIADFKAWLDAQFANTADKPYKAKLILSGGLGGGSGASGSLGAALKANSGKYVDLDLSGCTGLTGIGNDTFKECDTLVGIKLPASGITAIGDYAFYKCTGLTGIILPNGVLTIGKYAFYGCTGLAGTIVIPVGVTTIGEYAFYGCINITVITIPASVTVIGINAFTDCAKLTAINVDPNNPNFTSVDGVLYNKAKTILIAFPAGKGGAFTIPNGVNEIGGYGFYNSKGLTGVTIPSGVAIIGEYAFFGCTGLNGVTLPNTIIEIRRYAFNGCINIAVIRIPFSVILIGEKAFSGCTKLLEVIFDGSIDPSKFAADAFDGLGDIRAQYFDPAFGSGKYNRQSGGTAWVYSDLDGNPVFNTITGFKEWLDKQKTNTPATAYNAKMRLSGGLGGGSGTSGSLGAALKANPGKYVNLDLSRCTGLTGIENEAFKDCATLVGIIFPPNGITIIGDKAFEECINLVGIIIPDGVTKIGERAFYHCIKLVTIFIPAKVVTIGIQAFAYCIGLTSIDVDPNNPNFSSVDGVLYNKAKTIIIFFPAGKTGSFTIPNGVNEIGDYAFYYGKLTGITIPSGVTRIGKYAFYYCTGLTGLTLPSTIIFIGERAFENCIAITFVTIPSGVDEIGERAFYNCTGLVNLIISDGVKKIGKQAFSGCNKIVNLIIPGSVITIGERAFEDCTGLTGLTISDGVKNIEKYAFYNCIKITTITIPATIIKLEEYVFYKCTGLIIIIFRGGPITYFDPNAFDGFNGLKDNYDRNGGGEYKPNNGTWTNTVSLNSVTANGSATQTTTELTLTFSSPITGLTKDDITISASGIVKGTLSGSGPTYTLPISGFTNGGSITVTVAQKQGYTLSPSSKTLTIYYYAITLSSVTANGFSMRTTTKLTLNFNTTIPNLSENDITLSGVSGVVKGTLSGSGPSYTLPISGFTNGGTLTVSVYGVSGSKTVTIYYNANSGTPVTNGTTLAQKLSWLSSNAASNNIYRVEISADETISPTTLSYSGKTNVTVCIEGEINQIIDIPILGGGGTSGGGTSITATTIYSSANGSMFTVSSGVTLVLSNITLSGRSSNTASLVMVNSGGTLVLDEGSTIKGNTFYTTSTTSSTSAYGGGVYVSGGGTLLMEGGNISNNYATSRYSRGGGVYVAGTGNFTMNSGKISNNTVNYTSSSQSSEPYGGGVYVDNSNGNTNGNGNFIMNGGEISGNTCGNSYASYAWGGGVGGIGSFVLNGGKISGNTATSGYNSSSNSRGGGVYFEKGFTMNGGEISGNTASSSGTASGGGVSVMGSPSANFTKTGGIIYGYSSGDANSNVVKNSSGTVQNSRGHAVYMAQGNSPSTCRRETTAGPSVNLDSNKSGSAGGWE